MILGYEKRASRGVKLFFDGVLLCENSVFFGVMIGAVVVGAVSVIGRVVVGAVVVTDASAQEASAIVSKSHKKQMKSLRITVILPVQSALLGYDIGFGGVVLDAFDADLTALL